MVGLTPAQLSLLEDHRAGANLVLFLELTGVATLPPRRDSGNTEPVTGPISASSGAASRRVEIPREHWLKVLAQLGGDRIRLLELPELGLAELADEWKTVTGLLEHATLRERQGEPDKALADLRQVLEGS